MIFVVVQNLDGETNQEEVEAASVEEVERILRMPSEVAIRLHEKGGDMVCHPQDSIDWATRARAFRNGTKIAPKKTT